MAERGELICLSFRPMAPTPGGRELITSIEGAAPFAFCGTRESEAMYPELFSMPAYETFILLAIAVGGTTYWMVGGALGLSRARFAVVISLLILSALSGSKVQSLLERQAIQSFGWEFANGFRYTGGVLGALAALLLLVRFGVVTEAAWTLLDPLALAICSSMTVVRVGCFLEGCCFGAVWNGPFAVTFPANSPAWHAQVIHGLIRPDRMSALPVHPLQLYFGLWSALLFLALLALSRRISRPGTIFLLFVCLDGFAHYILEGFRFEPVRVNAVAGLLGGVGGAVGLVRFWIKDRVETTSRQLPAGGAWYAPLFRRQ